jgi:ParB/RepB/Spo0J family partition protein
MSTQKSMAGNPAWELIEIDQLPMVETPKGNAPYKQLKQSLTSLGMLVPITVHRQRKGYRLISGRRRLAAARELGWLVIPAMVYSNKVHESFIPSATIAENAIRSDNLRADIESVAELRSQNHTAATIVELTGMPMHDVMRILDLLELPEEIVEGVRTGDISRTTADQLRKSTPAIIASAREVYRANGKFTVNDIKQLRSVGFQEAIGTLELPEVNFGPTLREQIIAVLQQFIADRDKIVLIEQIVYPQGQS